MVWIDDQHDNNRSERAALEREGVRFALASSHQEVMHQLDSAAVDLVVTDMRRGADAQAGLQLLQALRANHRAVHVIFYVGVANEKLRTRALEAGALAVIQQRDQLLNTMRSALADIEGR